MQTDVCRVCRGQSGFVFAQDVIGHRVSYFECPACGYLQTERPYWLDAAYSSAINDVDTGILLRNRLNLGRVVMTLLAIRKLHGVVVDHAGGYGILVRLLRDAGVDARWRDKYCQNLLARGFDDDGIAGCDLLTAFEVFEHLVEPTTELDAMLSQAPVVLLSTELIPTAHTPSPDWWYIGPEHGQHVGFFRARTLTWMARRLGCHFSTDGAAVHLFSRSPVSRAWLPLVRARRLWPLVARASLRSRTMTDFDRLRMPKDRSIPS
jgi:hypothetical protein